MRLAFFGIVAIVLMGCAASVGKPTESKPAESKPEWMMGSSSQHPNTTHFTGRGSGASQMIAADRARADLLKILQVQIQSHTQDSRQAWGGAQLEGFAQSFSSEVSTSASGQLEGVEIADRHFEPSSNLHYALAVLDRTQALGRIDRQMAALEEAVASDALEGARADDPWVRVRSYHRALEALVKRDALEATRSVVDPSGAPPVAYSGAQSIRNEFDRAVRSVGLSVSGDEAAARLLSGALDRSGFVLRSAQSATFDLQGALNPSVQLREGWYWSRLELEVLLYDRSSGVLRTHLRFEARSSATDERAALDRAMQALEQQLQTQLLRELIDDR